MKDIGNECPGRPLEGSKVEDGEKYCNERLSQHHRKTGLVLHNYQAKNQA
jgi:hypothetical protein